MNILNLLCDAVEVEIIWGKNCAGVTAPQFPPISTKGSISLTSSAAF